MAKPSPRRPPTCGVIAAGSPAGLLAVRLRPRPLAGFRALKTWFTLKVYGAEALGAAKQVHVSDEQANPFVLQHDDVFIVRHNGDINRVAKAAIYKRASRDLPVFPDKLMRLRPDPAKMLPDFLVFAPAGRRVREQVAELGKTTAGNIGISAANAKSFVIPVPPLARQYKIVAELDALQAEAGKVTRLHVETAAALDALLSAILHRAFKGEL